MHLIPSDYEIVINDGKGESINFIYELRPGENWQLSKETLLHKKLNTTNWQYLKRMTYRGWGYHITYYRESNTFTAITPLPISNKLTGWSEDQDAWLKETMQTLLKDNPRLAEAITESAEKYAKTIDEFQSQNL